MKSTCPVHEDKTSIEGILDRKDMASAHWDHRIDANNYLRRHEYRLKYFLNPENLRR